MHRRFHRWQDLEVEDVARLAAVLMWLSPDGLRYYLPALLSITSAFPDAFESVSWALVNELAMSAKARDMAALYRSRVVRSKSRCGMMDGPRVGAVTVSGKSTSRPQST
jgi:hypothetical protein